MVHTRVNSINLHESLHEYGAESHLFKEVTKYCCGEIKQRHDVNGESSEQKVTGGGHRSTAVPQLGFFLKSQSLLKRGKLLGLAGGKRKLVAWERRPQFANILGGSQQVSKQELSESDVLMRCQMRSQRQRFAGLAGLEIFTE